VAVEVLRYSPWYRRVFAENGLAIENISSERSFAERVPFTFKEDLQGHADDFVLQPSWLEGPGHPQTEILSEAHLATYRTRVENQEKFLEDIEPPEDLHSKIYREYLRDWQPILSTRTGGSTGASVDVSYTYSDIVGPFYRAGLLHHSTRPWSPTQRFMSLYPAGGHLGFYAGFLIPLMHGQPVKPTMGGRIMSTEDQVLLASQKEIQVIHGTTSYVAHWLDVACKFTSAGEIDGLPRLEVVIVAGEALTEEYARSIKRNLNRLGASGARLIQGMSSTELKAGGFHECDEGTGLHIDPQHFYVEILDPETKKPVPEGSPGVFVWSHIGWHGTVILRYWSGDIVEGGMTWGECPNCHLVLPRLFPPFRRLHADFVKVRGARVDVTELRTALESVLGRDGFQVVISRNSKGVGQQSMVIFANNRGEVTEEAIRDVVMSVVELRVDRVEFVSSEDLERRLYADGWKPRWLIRE
jgi:phenylacetate-coenzyme A ligase PaaK-like adenylate-forming protein